MGGDPSLKDKKKRTPTRLRNGEGMIPRLEKSPPKRKGGGKKS